MNIDIKDAVRQVVEIAHGGPNTAMYIANIVENFADKSWNTNIRIAVAVKMVEYDRLLPKDSIGKLLVMMADDPCPKVRECVTELLDFETESHRVICEKLLIDSEESVVQAALKVKR